MTENCPVCGTPVRVVGDVTKRYEPVTKYISKDEMIKILDDFYNEMQEAEQLAYISCKIRDEAQEHLFDKYADMISTHRD